MQDYIVAWTQGLRDHINKLANLDFHVAHPTITGAGAFRDFGLLRFMF
jgi:hypothetical protein